MPYIQNRRMPYRRDVEYRPGGTENVMDFISGAAGGFLQGKRYRDEENRRQESHDMRMAQMRQQMRGQQEAESLQDELAQFEVGMMRRKDNDPFRQWQQGSIGDPKTASAFGQAYGPPQPPQGPPSPYGPQPPSGPGGPGQQGMQPGSFEVGLTPEEMDFLDRKLAETDDPQAQLAIMQKGQEILQQRQMAASMGSLNMRLQTLVQEGAMAPEMVQMLQQQMQNAEPEELAQLAQEVHQKIQALQHTKQKQRQVMGATEKITALRSTPGLDGKAAMELDGLLAALELDGMEMDIEDVIKDGYAIAGGMKDELDGSRMRQDFVRALPRFLDSYSRYKESEYGETMEFGDWMRSTLRGVGLDPEDVGLDALLDQGLGTPEAPPTGTNGEMGPEPPTRQGPLQGQQGAAGAMMGPAVAQGMQAQAQLQEKAAPFLEEVQALKKKPTRGQIKRLADKHGLSEEEVAALLSQGPVVGKRAAAVSGPGSDRMQRQLEIRG